jgi:hypothetical protein
VRSPPTGGRRGEAAGQAAQCLINMVEYCLSTAMRRMRRLAHLRKVGKSCLWNRTHVMAPEGMKSSARLESGVCELFSPISLAGLSRPTLSRARLPHGLGRS